MKFVGSSETLKLVGDLQAPEQTLGVNFCKALSWRGWWWDWWTIVVGGGWWGGSNSPFQKSSGNPFGKFSKAGRTLLQSPSGWAATRKMAKLCTPRRGNHLEEFMSVGSYSNHAIG